MHRKNRCLIEEPLICTLKELKTQDLPIRIVYRSLGTKSTAKRPLLHCVWNRCDDMNTNDLYTEVESIRTKSLVQIVREDDTKQ